jgi:wobble nucleotide-excising tRNase
LKERIDCAKSTIDNVKNSISTLEWSRKSKNDLVESCQNDFSELISQYKMLSENYCNALDKLVAYLNKKFNSLFVKLNVNVNDTAQIELGKWIDNVENVFIRHNKIVSNFDKNRNLARDKYKQYLVATFLITENYYKTKRFSEIENRGQEKWQSVIDRKERENIELSNQLKSITKGKEQLNIFIQRFLNRNDISIDITDYDQFILKRGKCIAKNLSEGEKSAIAFAYYMVTLESLGDDIKNQIIFIDDPISSLDSNHIAQVSYLINTFFFRKGLDPNNAEKVCNYFKQLFITTHNFEFFSFLHDATNIKRKDLGKFMIKRENEEKSILINLPKSFGKCKSEYVYLFSEIDSFKENNCPDDKSYMMPNIIRRFLEIYTLIKLPGSTSEIDDRIKQLYGENFDELKILHMFSHFTSFERAVKHDEIIQRLPDIIKDLYNLLGKDTQHLKSLYEGIGKKSLIPTQ